MIIQFSKNLELSDWSANPDGLVRYKQKVLGGMIFHDQPVVVLFIKNDIVKHIRFYEPIFQLDELYNPDNVPLDLSINFAKSDVDKFLIRMSKLTAFF